MVNQLVKYQRLIAGFLFGLFYLNLVAVLSAGAVSMEQSFYYMPRYFGQEDIARTMQAGSTIEKGRIIEMTTPVALEEGPQAMADQENDIDGPGQPEMGSFASAGTSNMVDLFTGDFSYNLPLMDVGGYPLNIHYSSGISMDQEASWVGLGWNINPGTISRSVRGLPDDFNGTDTMTREQSIKLNKTVGAKVGGDLEIFGLPIGVAQLGVFHNNYNGWGIEYGINASINAGGNAKGPLSASLGVTNNSQTGLDISPSLAIRIGKKEAEMNGSVTIGSNYNSRSGISGLQLSTEVRRNYTLYNNTNRSIGMGVQSYFSFATPSYTPTITMPLTNRQLAFTGKLGFAAAGTFPNLFVEGYVSKQFIRDKDKIQKLPAFGYLHLSKSGKGKELLDFNREKDIPFSQKTSPHIAIPQYTYDLYSISGEGTGGMFRPYRSDIGYIFDHKVSTNSESDKISGDIGPGVIFHGGVDFSNTTATTSTGIWKSQNALLKNIEFAHSDSTLEEVYFRNPGEKALNATSFYRQVGGDSLVRVRLDGSGKDVVAASALTKFSQARPAGEVDIPGPIVKTARDKRTQVISYLNAIDASKYALEKSIRNYLVDSNQVMGCDNAYDTISRVDALVHKPHHISEIRVLNADGRRYIYGLPAYNVEQQEVTFAVSKEENSDELARGTVHYGSGDNSLQNSKGKDNYYTKDITPAYAHSFLLTGLLSSDYIDIKGDGITEDDLGDGVKFNYSEIYGASNGYYLWRTPSAADRANYNEGLKTYSRDDKATYIFGKKEVWYLHSVESKTMVALFRVSNRNDAMSVLGEDGGNDATKKLKKVDSIQLFVKSDLVKNGIKARPVKTVHFEYNYELCKKITGPSSEGKLTLKKIWFSYNGNYKGKLNPYGFSYHPDDAGVPITSTNPDYNPKRYDRWGNYKDPADNPGSLNNIDYPYAIQDAAKAAAGASAWHLTDVKLPSGGRLNITYEADDYGYVQDKRATQFFSLAGLGSSAAATPVAALYDGPNVDYNFVFVNATSPVTTRQEIFDKYLEGIEKIYFKVAVKMPTDQWGSGYELVPTYGEIANYGVVAGNSGRFWIQLKPVDGESPIARAAVQFLRLNLPGKAFPASELGDDLDLGSAISMLVLSFTEIANSINGFGNQARLKGWCKQITETSSFIRLNSPELKKYGGGIRVRRVKLYDNWKKMTARGAYTGMKESVYGQEYSYTTTRELYGQKLLISSGVATYEPMVGAEENPFRTPIEYTEKVAPMAPTNYAYTERPLGESFFPSPMVGYSKVRVRTINAKAKSANGWEESEFFTSKDFPTRVDFTPFDGDSKKRYNPKLRNLLRIDAKHYLTLSQGFRVILNDMNGKLKSQAFYPENDSLNAIHYTENYYKRNNAQGYQNQLSNKVWTVDSANGSVNKNSEIGKEVEVLVDLRQQISSTYSASVSANVDIFPFLPPLIPILVIPSKIPLPQHEENRYRSVALVKIVQQYGILDSVVVRDKGSNVSTKNLLYDGETGNVLLSRTNNEFDDPVYNFNYPAHWAYSGMGMAYKNIDVVLSKKRFTDGKMVIGNDMGDRQELFFESGDEIIANGYLRLEQSAPPNGNDCPENIYSEVSSAKKLWAIDAGKGKFGHKGIYLIDEDGKPYSANYVSLRILRSGRRNMTDASVGSIVSLANPVREVSTGVFRIIFDTASRVLNTNAAVFKDLWQVENSLFAKDTVYRVYHLFNQTFYPTEISRRAMKVRGNGDNLEDYYYSGVNSVVSSYNFLRNGSGCRSRIMRSKSMLRYELGVIPPEATITSATITLAPRKPENIWRVIDNGCNGGNFSQSYDWNAATDYYTGDSRVYLKRITKQWNSNTSYDAFSVTSTNQVQFNSSTFTSVSCTGLIQDAVQQQSYRYGFMFDILKQNPTSTSSTEINYLSFCAKHDQPNGIPSCDTSVALKAISPACTCTRPTLQVSYQTLVDSVATVCRFNINDSSFNPYRWGVLGNWRMDRAYTYYHDRVESNASVTTTNIRKEGELKDFTPYWQFASTRINPTADSSKWVWNSAITYFNRKGFEIENMDALGRFNSGLYGYNQTVPIAVGQNSRVRELLFDGFEDYNYKTIACNAICEAPREIDFLKDNSNASINTQYSHTGRYSLLVNPDESADLSVPIKTAVNDAIKPALYIKVDSTPVYNTLVTGKGLGLTATYSCVLGSGTPVTRVEGPIKYKYDAVTGLPTCGFPPSLTLYGAVWTGKIQPKYTDDYTFRMTSTMSFAGVRVGGQQVIASGSNGGTRTSAKIRLEAGKLYDIVINYPSFNKQSGSIELWWSSTQFQSLEIVPKENLYRASMVTADSVGSVQKNLQYYCIKLNNVKPENVIRPFFSPLQGSKLVVSAWVNNNPAGCMSTTAEPLPQGQITVTFNADSPSAFTLQPTGVAIEGWQRFEGVVNVPATATSMVLSLASATGLATYFDDIRVQPYNSQVKAFVYDPINLRLMAGLDENNYASFYEYDDDGTLIRTKKETEKGIKTISETRSALFKEE